ncbi:MAG: hypothetical protein GXP26_10335 [Planctomycetes bacterium]|nr:hypothetical protein [Planctomycetota bacterium]
MRMEWIFVFGTLLFTAGCGSSEVAWVSGKVTYAGEEVSEGALRFFPTEGTPGSGAGAKIIDGHYEITIEMAEKRRLVAGGYRITVVASRKTGKMFPHPDGEGMVEHSQMYIPNRYNMQTQLEAELQPGENAHDLILER